MISYSGSIFGYDKLKAQQQILEQTTYSTGYIGDGLTLSYFPEKKKEDDKFIILEEDGIILERATAWISIIFDNYMGRKNSYYFEFKDGQGRDAIYPGEKSQVEKVWLKLALAIAGKKHPSNAEIEKSNSKSYSSSIPVTLSLPNFSNKFNL